MSNTGQNPETTLFSRGYDSMNAPRPPSQASAFRRRYFITTKRAYEELEREGLIVTQTGRGSFVAQVSGARLREEQLRAVEAHLAQAVRAAKQGGVTAEEFMEIAQTAFEEGNQ